MSTTKHKDETEKGYIYRMGLRQAELVCRQRLLRAVEKVWLVVPWDEFDDGVNRACHAILAAYDRLATEEGE